MAISLFLVDDHAIVRNGLRMILEYQPDMQVVGTAANGRDAVRQVSRLRPDVVLMDIVMPELNGIDATEQITEKNPSTKVIILSMYSDTPHIFRALRAGASGYVMKEGGETELISAVRAVHSGRRFLSGPIEERLIDNYIMDHGSFEVGDPLSSLSPRERQIFTLLVEGKTTRVIGATLGLSQKTVNTYRYRIMDKLSISDAPSLIRFGIENGLTSST